MIKIKLPKTVGGKELATIVEKSMKSLEGYKIYKQSEEAYTPGSVAIEEEKRQIEAWKPIPKTNIFGGLLQQWFGRRNYRISTSITFNRTYHELMFDVSTACCSSCAVPPSYSIRTLAEKEPELKQEFEILVGKIYESLR